MTAQAEEDIYHALKTGHPEDAKNMLISLLMAEKDTQPGTDKDFVERQMISAAFGKLDPTQLLGFAIQYANRGLFRYMLEEYPEIVRAQGLAHCRTRHKKDFIGDILDAGADVQYAAGGWLYDLVSAGEKEIVTDMLRRGVDANRLWVMFGDNLHSLQAAASIHDRDRRQEFIDLLLDAGADLRVEGCKPLKQMMSAGLVEVFDIYERLDPGSEMVSILACSRSSSAADSIVKKARERLPSLPSQPDDLSVHDGLRLKLAVAAPDAESAVPRLLKEGAPVNTQKDSPLKIVALLGKKGLLDALIKSGADIYADHASLLRGMDNIYQEDISAALCDKMEDAAQLYTAAPHSGEKNAELLRAAKAGQLGACIADGRLSYLTAEDLLHENENGTTVASVLAAREEYDILFSPKIWSGRAPDIEKVWQTLDRAEKKQAAGSYQLLLRTMGVTWQQQRLKEKAKLYKLRPGRP